MNIKLVQKNLLIRAAIAIAILAVVGGITLAVSMLYNAQIETQAKAKAKLDATNTQNRTLKDKIVRATESLNIYQAINSRGGGLSLNREYAKKLLDQMKQEYLLNALDVSITPVTDEPGGSGDTKLISARVTVKMDAFTDELVFAFVNAIKLRFPGYVRIERFDVTRTADITREAYVNVTRGVLANLVHGEIEFKWIGVKPNDAKADGGASTSAAPTGSSPAANALPGTNMPLPGTLPSPGGPLPNGVAP